MSARLPATAATTATATAATEASTTAATAEPAAATTATETGAALTATTVGRALALGLGIGALRRGGHDPTRLGEAAFAATNPEVGEDGVLIRVGPLWAVVTAGKRLLSSSSIHRTGHRCSLNLPQVDAGCEAAKGTHPPPGCNGAGTQPP